MNALEVKDIKKEKGNVIKREKLSFLVLLVLLTGLWDFDIINSRQNLSKNKLVRENAVTRVHSNCSLQFMGSCFSVCAMVFVRL